MECNSYKGLFIEYVREMFGKTTISYPPDTHTYVSVSTKE